MTGSVAIVTDSGCDLPADLATEHGIEIVPLTVRFGNEELVDRRDLSPADFWARVATSRVLPETSAPSPGAFEEAFRAAAGRGAVGVVCLTLSASLSATFQAAQLAAQAVAATVPVEVIDTRAVSIAEGMLAVTAARLAAEGRSLVEVVSAIGELVPRTRIYAALDTLENLRKGGRIGSAQALLGSMLSIKPVIQVADGKVEPESRQRTRARSLRYLADKVNQARPVENLAVVHGSAPDVGELVAMLQDAAEGKPIVVAEVGAVIGTHAGPRVVGVTFNTTR